MTAPPQENRAAPVPAVAGWLAAALRDHPFRFAVLGTVAVLLLSLLVYSPCYETNDDAAMNLIAGGLAFAGRPDEHLLFTNVLVGLTMRWLYERAPTFPWYGLFQFAAVAVAACGSVYALLRVNPSPRQAAVAALFLGVGVLPCLAEVQFTKTAFLASLAGLLVFLAPLRGAGPLPRAATAAAAALVVLGALVRFDSFLLACMMVAPPAVAAAWLAPARALRAAVPLTATAALAVALQVFNQSYYARDEGWRDFYAYNALRARFTDYDRYDYTPAGSAGFAAVGWDAVDLEMLKNWFFADPDRYSLAKLEQVTAAVPTAPPTLRQAADFAMSQLVESPGLLRLVLAGFCVALLTGEGWRRFAMPVLSYGLAFGLMVALGVSYWLPARVAFPILCGALAAAALRPAADVAAPATYAGRAAGVCGAALAAALVLWSAIGLAESNRERLRQHQATVDVLRKLHPQSGTLYVVWREILPFENLVTPFNVPAVLHDFRCVSLGFLLPTPITRERLREFGIDDLYTAICERPDVNLITSPHFIGLFEKYVRHHYGSIPRLRPTFLTQGRFPVVVFQAVPGRLPRREQNP